MGLIPVDLVLPRVRHVPRSVAEFLLAADSRVEAVGEALQGRSLGFVASDFREVYAALLALRDSPVLAERFCEWGSGLGIVAGLAAMVGFDSCGIEIRPELVRESRGLLSEFELDVEILEGSFVPESFAEEQPFTDNECVTVLSGPGAHDEVDVTIDDFDVIFAFPWPAEEDMYFELFERFAASGEHLITYHGPVEGIRFHRKE